MDASSSNSPVEERLCLRWNNYSHNLKEVFSEHHMNERFVDVILVCEGHYIKAHKLILSACSTYFQDVFNNQLDTFSQICLSYVVLPGIPLNHLQYIIDFMYNGEVKVFESELEGVLALGQHLQVKGLCAVKLTKKIETPTDSNTTPPLVNMKSSKPHKKRTVPNILSRTSISQSILRDNSHNSAAIQPKPNILLSPFKTLQNNSNPSVEDEHIFTHIQQKSKQEADSNQQAETVVPNTTKEKSSTKTSVNTENILQDEPLNMSLSAPNPLATASSTSNGEIKSSTNDSRDAVSETQSAGSTFNLAKFLARSKNVSMADRSSGSPKYPLIQKGDKKKSLNPFMLFTNEYRSKLSQKYPDESKKEISLRVSDLWKSMSTEEKKVYYKQARQLNPRRSGEHPMIKKKPKMDENVLPKVNSSKDTDDDDDVQVIECKVHPIDDLISID